MVIQIHPPTGNSPTHRRLTEGRKLLKKTMGRELLVPLLLLVAVLVGSARGQCPAALAYCSCSNDIIECNGRSLSEVPGFKATSKQYHNLLLDHNNIENITNDAFLILGVNILDLSYNDISLIEVGAFRGLETTLEYLNLQGNKLKSLPVAIGPLTIIDRLDVAYNEIDGNQFHEDTMRKIGDTLTRFDFGSESVHTWPPTVRHLQNLAFLNVTGGTYYTLPPEAFHGFEGTLRTLAIQDTGLIAIPLALARLRYLDRLYLDHNHAIGDSGILIPSFGDADLLKNLKYISLRDDNLTVFPTLLHFLRNVTTLVLDSNRLAFVSDTSVQVAVGTNIVNLSLRNCSLTRVPGAMAKLTNLTSLDLSNNNIHSFENDDFINMRHLQNLTISGNPVEYIATDCFRELDSLTTLDLRDTKLNAMPEAIQSLRSLTHLYVPQGRLECTCNVVWLKDFIRHCNRGLKIEGSCETIVSTIDKYLDEHIPNCPNYNETAAYVCK